MARTSIGSLTQALGTLNPWWRTAHWAADDPDLREVRRSGLGYASDCLRDLRPGGLYVLRGPRRVGKTVAMTQAIVRLIDDGAPPSAIVRLAVDDWSDKDILNVVQSAPLPMVPADVARWWFIDEITGATGAWASAIKWLRDNHAPFRDATVVIAGSDAGVLTQAIGLWAGRRGHVSGTDRTLLPIGFRSYAQLLSAEPLPRDPRLDLRDVRSGAGRDAMHGLIPWIGQLTSMWERYLLSGGFPVAAAAARVGLPPPEAFLDDLFDVVFRYVLRDSQASEGAAMSLLARVMAGMGSPANLRAIANDLGIDHKTVARHVGYLQNGYLAWSCPQKDDRRWLARHRTQAKLYAIDPLVARLPHLRHPARPDVDLTVLAEMMLGLAIRRAGLAEGATWAGEDFLFHHRTAARAEIDFVSQALNGAAIESKYTSRRSWRSAAAAVDASPWRGILATRDVLDVSADATAWAVPCGVLAYLLDT